MRLRLLVPVFLYRPLLLVLCIALNGCGPNKANSGPSIEFTHIQPAPTTHDARGAMSYFTPTEVQDSSPQIAQVS